MKETYLGDGLYAKFDGFGIELKAERDGMTHWVYLEPNVYLELTNFMDGIKEENKKNVAL